MSIQTTQMAGEANVKCCTTCGLPCAPYPFERSMWLAKGYCWTHLDGDGYLVPEGQPTADCLRRALHAAWKASGVADMVRGMVPLAEVVAQYCSDLDEARVRIVALESKLRFIATILHETDSPEIRGTPETRGTVAGLLSDVATIQTARIAGIPLRRIYHQIGLGEIYEAQGSHAAETALLERIHIALATASRVAKGI